MKTRCWPEKKGPRKEKGKKTPGRTKARRKQGQETEGMKDALSAWGGRFTSFTPLTTSIDQVLMQIKDEGALTFPGKLKSDPNK